MQILLLANNVIAGNGLYANENVEIGDNCRAKWNKEGRFKEILEVAILGRFIVGKSYFEDRGVVVTPILYE